MNITRIKCCICLINDVFSAHRYTNNKYCLECNSNMLQGRDFIRELVRRRDKHTCQSCKKAWEKGQRRFDIHHLNGFCGKKSKKYDKISEIDGLITLCHKCHFNHPEHSQKLSTKV